MDNPVANQLPDVDALPDGFVESPPESVAPVTPSIEIDIKKNKALTPDSSNDSSYEGKAEKVPKVRTFPVPLSDKDDVIDNGHMELREDTSATKSESSTSAAGGPDSKTTITNEKDKGQNNTAPQSSRKCMNRSTWNPLISLVCFGIMDSYGKFICMENR